MYDIKQLLPVVDGDKKEFIDLVNTIVKSFAQLIWHRFAKWNFKFNSISNSTINSLAEHKDKIKSENVKESKQYDKPSKPDQQTNKHDILSCKKYKQCDMAARWDIVYDYRGFACCLGSGHYYTEEMWR